MTIKVTNKTNFKALQSKLKTAIQMYGETEAKKLEGEAKRTAPWTDRTANARNSIQGKFYWNKDRGTIQLSGNMDYSVYLELANEKKYAVLVPTIKKNSGDILNGFKRLVK